MNILCWLGIHKKRFRDEFTPSITAIFLERYQAWTRCVCCGKVEKVADYIFEKKSGQEVMMKEIRDGIEKIKDQTIPKNMMH